jgi:hypothetical protein
MQDADLPGVKTVEGADGVDGRMGHNFGGHGVSGKQS